LASPPLPRPAYRHRQREVGRAKRVVRQLDAAKSVPGTALAALHKQSERLVRQRVENPLQPPLHRCREMTPSPDKRAEGRPRGQPKVTEEGLSLAAAWAARGIDSLDCERGNVRGRVAPVP
jgi:hypothetical protein